MAQTEKKCNA